MTWETQEERDGLADNRERIWNRKTPLWESGELPMSETRELQEAMAMLGDARRAVAAYEQIVVEKDQQIAALRRRCDIIEAAYRRFVHVNLTLCEVADDDPIYQIARELWLAVKKASEPSSPAAAVTTQEKKSVGLCDCCTHHSNCHLIGRPPTVGFVNSCTGYSEFKSQGNAE